MSSNPFSDSFRGRSNNQGFRGRSNNYNNNRGRNRGGRGGRGGGGYGRNNYNQNWAQDKNSSDSRPNYFQSNDSQMGRGFGRGNQKYRGNQNRGRNQNFRGKFRERDVAFQEEVVDNNSNTPKFGNKYQNQNRFHDQRGRGNYNRRNYSKNERGNKSFDNRNADTEFSFGQNHHQRNNFNTVDIKNYNPFASAGFASMDSEMEVQELPQHSPFATSHAFPTQNRNSNNSPFGNMKPHLQHTPSFENKSQNQSSFFEKMFSGTRNSPFASNLQNAIPSQLTMQPSQNFSSPLLQMETSSVFGRPNMGNRPSTSAIYRTREVHPFLKELGFEIKSYPIYEQNPTSEAWNAARFEDFQIPDEIPPKPLFPYKN